MHIQQGTKGHKANLTKGKSIHISDVMKMNVMMKHNNRTKYTGSHIDLDRSSLNETLIGNSETKVFQEIMNRLYERNVTEKELRKFDPKNMRYADGSKIPCGSTRQAVAAVEWESQYPGDMAYANFDSNGNIYYIPDSENIDEQGRGDFLYPADMDEFNRWKELTLEFMKDLYGEDNLIHASVHMDETTPHIHFITTPIVTKENGTKHFHDHHFVDGSNDLKRIQTEYAAHISELGYKRGDYSSVKIKKSDMTYVRRLAAQALGDSSVAYDKIKTLAEHEGREFMATIFVHIATAKKELKELTENFETLTQGFMKQKDKIKDLEAEKKRLEELLKQKEIQLKSFQQDMRRRMCEEKGFELCDDTELRNAYASMQSQFIESGARHFERVGMFVDLDFDGRDDRLEIKDENNNGIDDNIDTIVDTNNNGIDDRNE